METVLEIKKEDMDKQFLSSNNAIRYFIELYCNKKNTNFIRDIPINSRRYHLLLFRKNSHDYFLFIKYVEYPYLKADGGFSESINVKDMKTIMSYYNQNKLKYCYFVYKSGYILRTDPTNFLKYGWIETDKEGTDRYILNWNQKDENDNFVFQRFSS